MALLFITPQEITNTTVLGGNVDVNKYEFFIESVQFSVIEPLLGTELYDKIVTDVTNSTISDDYLTLYKEFVKPITKNEALAEYIEVAGLSVNNGGVFKHAPESAEIATNKEVEALAGKYHHLAQMYVQRFEKWICNNTITEYKRHQDEVNAQNVQTRGGWFLDD